MIKNPHWQQGQSLIEILVSVFIISTALTTIVLLTTKSVQLSGIAQNRETAVALAKSELEVIRNEKNSISWSDFSDLKNTGFITSPKYPAKSTDGRYDIIRKMTTDLNDTTVPPDPNKVFVTVTVSWDDAKGRHEVTQSTMFTHY